MTASDHARALLTAAAIDRDGYLDVLGHDVASPTPTLAQRAMNAPLLATVYERVWRPTAFFVASGVSTSAEWRHALNRLRLEPGQRVLDVACGPGLFTRPLGRAVEPDGLAIGLDISAPMLHRAVRDNDGPATTYVRGDAGQLPFADGTFDAVCCFGALYLVPEPIRVVDEMIRVLTPGGRIALLTSYAGRTVPTRELAVRLGGAIGLRVFDRATFPEQLTAAGLRDVEQEIRGVTQFVSAARPGD